jgi:hypothetical protein
MTTPLMPSHTDVNKSFTQFHAAANDPATDAHTPPNQSATPATTPTSPYRHEYIGRLHSHPHFMLRFLKSRRPFQKAFILFIEELKGRQVEIQRDRRTA